jgi:hypothetical protein
MNITPGMRLGRYEIRAKIGEGGIRPGQNTQVLYVDGPLAGNN